jgi:predicted ATPase/DNA-binding SARP family transcriptional activator
MLTSGGGEHLEHRPARCRLTVVVLAPPGAVIRYRPKVDFRILGSLAVAADDGTPIPIPGTKQRLLLAALLIRAPQVVSVDQLTEILWGEDQPADPRNALQIQVGQLRRRLGPRGRDLIVLRPPGYALEVSAQSVDAIRFEQLVEEGHASLAAEDHATATQRLRAALELWRGAPLEEFSGRWVGELSRLDELRLNAAEGLIEANLQLGQHAQLVPRLEELVHRHPLRETLRGQLMLALHRSGRQGEALEVFHETRRLLDEELGVPPTFALRRLHEQLLRQSDDPPPIPRPAATTVEPTPLDLPCPISSFVGREQELARTLDLLHSGPLLTLVGPGGVGKTRLAIEAARRTAEAGQFPGGIWFVDLGLLTDPVLVASTVARTLGLGAADSGATDPRLALEPLDGRVRDQPALLVLDNCEHLIDATAVVVRDLLSSARQITVLCTSREALGLAGEAVWSVPSLAMPPRGQTVPIPKLAACDAVQLFTDRAATAQPGFVLDASAAPLVAELCRRLDGIPLALELAAARLRLLGLPALTQRIEDRFRLLTAGERTAQPRQRTLRAMVDWSWDLLDEQERRLLRRLTVFAGSFTLEMVEQVCTDEALPGEQVLDVLGRLVDKSLVVPAIGDDHPRYRLLETLRAYGAERLQEAEERTLLHERHAQYVVRFATEFSPQLRADRQLEAVQVLEERIDDLRAGLGWLQERGELEQLARQATSLGWYWYLGGRRREGERWLATVQDVTDPRLRSKAAVWRAFLALDNQPVSALRAGVDAALTKLRELDGNDGPFARLVAALMATEAGDAPAVAAHLAAARQVARTEDARLLADLDVIEAMGLLQRGELTAGAAAITSALQHLETTGDRLGKAHALLMQAQLDDWSGHPTPARTHLEEALRLTSELHLRDIAGLAEARLASLLAELGDIEQAQAAITRARATATMLGSERLDIHADHAAALTEAVRGDLKESRRLHQRVLDWFAAREQPVVAAGQLHHLGVLAEREGNLKRAADLHLRGLETAHGSTRLPLPPEMLSPPAPPDTGGLLPAGLEALAATLAAAGNAPLAASLLAAATARRPLGEGQTPTATRAQALVTAQLDDDDEAAARAWGAEVDPSELIQRARQASAAPA